MKSTRKNHGAVAGRGSAVNRIAFGHGVVLAASLGCSGTVFTGFEGAHDPTDSGVSESARQGDAHPIFPDAQADRDDANASVSDAGRDACPRQEICNGIDDDCNGTTDEGCPIGISWVAKQDPIVLGASTGGSPFLDSCAAGEVLVGMHVAADSWVTQVRGACRAYTLGVDRGVVPFRYHVATSGQTTPLDVHPVSVSGTTALQPLVCPDDRALVGLKVSQEAWMQFIVITKIWATCASLVIEPDGHGGVSAIRSDDPMEIGPVAGWYASDAGETVDSNLLDGASVPIQLVGSSGSWIDRIGYGIANMSVATSPLPVGPPVTGRAR